MKAISILIAIVFASVNNVIAQINIDSHGNPVDVNGAFSTVKFSPSVSKSTSNSPIIINQIPSPTSYTCDIAYDGQYLWVEAYSDFLLYQISPVNGAVIKTIPSSIMRPYGLEFVNGYLWIADTDNKMIYKIDTITGNTITFFPTPAIHVTSYPTGLAWDGQYLWHNDAMQTGSNPNDSTYQINTIGQILQSHHAFGTYATGLAFDGQYLWSSNNVTQEIYKINISSFTVIDTINAPGGLAPNGLAFDGQYLWVANNVSDSLYQLDISNTNTGINQNSEASLNFSIHPNPTSDEIILETHNLPFASNYSITDSNGKQITNGKIINTKTIIDISKLATGIYFVQVGESSGQSFKVMKK